ncbi:MAG TPA: hypothetical protein VMF31_04890 [Solirubrobacterales bacterium]|nr:hypothetical protein [Solirubrobacterales bacterium]
MSDEKEVLHFESAEALREWFEANHDRSPGIWLKIAKKSSRVPAPSYEEAVNAGLCFGWIDSLTRRFDDDLYLMTFTPRRAKSPWSKSNVARVEALIESGQMRPAGQAQIDLAKKDGRWP